MKIYRKITPENYKKNKEAALAAIGDDIADIRAGVENGINDFNNAFAKDVTQEQIKANIVLSLKGKSLVEQHLCCLKYLTAMVEHIPQTDEAADFLNLAKEKAESFGMTAKLLENLKDDEYETVFTSKQLTENIDTMISLLTDSPVYTAVLFSQKSNYGKALKTYIDAPIDKIPTLVAESKEAIIDLGVTLYGLLKIGVIEDQEFTPETAGVAAAAAFAADDAIKTKADPTRIFEKITRVLRVLVPAASIFAVFCLVSYVLYSILPVLFVSAFMFLYRKDLIAIAESAGEKIVDGVEFIGEKIITGGKIVVDALKPFGLAVWEKGSEFVKTSYETISTWVQETVLPAVRDAYLTVTNFVTDEILIPVTAFVMKAKESTTNLYEKLVENCKNTIDYIISEARERSAEDEYDDAYDEEDFDEAGVLA